MPRPSIGAVVISLFLAVLASPQSIAGLWVGSAQRGTRSIPFSIEIAPAKTGLRARFIEGKEQLAWYPVVFDAGHLVADFGDYANRLDGTVKDGVLTGTFGGHVKPLPVTARLVPQIAGDWQVQIGGRKGESAWEMHVVQSGVNIEAVVQRIDGDTGTLYGSFGADGSFTLNRFTADGPDTQLLTPLPDGTLQVGRWIARRAAAARAAALPPPEDPVTHTRMHTDDARISFRYPDMDDRMVSSEDARFRHKVLIVTIGGSWCPNCHDEMPWLEALYQRYHARGLEIVDLDFEEDAGQIADHARLRAFVERFQPRFPVLYAGATTELNTALPQVDNLNCWPTTFFIGRDGLVKRIHAGFASTASVADHAELDRSSRALIERLLRAQ